MKKFLNVLSYIFLFVFYVISFIFIYNLYKLNILNKFYLGIFTWVVVFILLINTVIIFKKNTKILRFIAVISMITIIIIYGIFTYTLNNTRDYIKDAAKVRELEYRTYVVVTLKKDKIKKIDELKDKDIGFVSEELLFDNIATLSKIISLSEKKYNDVTELLNGLYKKEVSAISIDEGYLNSLFFQNDELKNKLKKLYKYEVYFKTTDTKEEKTDEDVDILKPFILYISGSDSRSNARSRTRSDTNIVAVVRPKEHKVLLVSIPRDYYVYLHGVDSIRDKLTHAGVYGIDMSINTIEDILDIDINKYVKVSFATVINGVDVVDGLDIDSDIDFTAFTNKSCHFYKGVQHVNGTCALAFARERKSYLEGDRHRGENQEQVISLMLDKLTQAKYLLRYNDLLDATRGSFDTNLTYDEMTSLIKFELNDLAKWNIDIYNLNGEGAMLPTYSMGSMPLWVMIPDEETIRIAKEKINEYLK